MTCPSVHPLRSSAQALLLHVLVLRLASVACEWWAVLMEQIRGAPVDMLKILTINNLPSVLFLSTDSQHFFHQQYPFSMKGECRWWLNKQGLMMYRRIIGTRMFGWFLQGRWKVSDFGPSFYSNKKRGTGSKKEALCHLLFASHGLFRWSFLHLS